MGCNILVTGGAGYIGGSVVAELISRKTGPIEAANIYAAVRSDEQVRSLSILGIHVVQLDLSDNKAVMEVVLANSIDIAINTATCVDSRVVSNLIEALGKRREVSGQETYLIHSSVLATFSEQGGWPFGEIRGDDSPYTKEKQLGGAHPVRATNLAVVEQSKAYGVTAFNIPLPNVYGRGSGEVRKVSVSIPTFVRTSVKHRIVYKFDKDAYTPAIHISDLTALYALLVEKILQREPVPSGEIGYYFAIAHRMSWWECMDRLAQHLYARGLVTEPKVQTWPSYEMAAKSLGWPPQHVRAMGTSSAQAVPVHAIGLGWRPRWDEKRFLDSLDEEVQDCLELDNVKSTLYDGLIASAKSGES